MFQGSVTMTEEYGAWWSYIPPFISTPGYVYAYSFGELLVLALYARYQSGEVRDFSTRYFDLLTAGGSDWPHEIVRPMGIDLTDASFWRHGLNILDDMVKDAEQLAAEIA
jgi:oligoendopeptidase F